MWPVLISSRSHVAVKRPSHRAIVLWKALESPSNNFQSQLIKWSDSRDMFGQESGPDICSRTKWPEVNVLTKQFAHFNFKPLWHEQMRDKSFVEKRELNVLGRETLCNYLTEPLQPKNHFDSSEGNKVYGVFVSVTMRHDHQLLHWVTWITPNSLKWSPT